MVHPLLIVPGLIELLLCLVSEPNEDHSRLTTKLIKSISEELFVGKSLSGFVDESLEGFDCSWVKKSAKNWSLTLWHSKARVDLVDCRANKLIEDPIVKLLSSLLRSHLKD